MSSSSHANTRPDLDEMEAVVRGRSPALIAEGDWLALIQRVRELEGVLHEVQSAYNRMSPSAPYEIRHRMIEKSKAYAVLHPEYRTSRWWDEYPDGHVVALVNRLSRILGKPMWEAPGEKLPSDT